jgi:hypothetical protein
MNVYDPIEDTRKRPAEYRIDESASKKARIETEEDYWDMLQ